MLQANDLSRSPADLHQESTLIAVIEMSQSSWLVASIIPGIERHALKKIEPNENTLLQDLTQLGQDISTANLSSSTQTAAQQAYASLQQALGMGTQTGSPSTVGQPFTVPPTEEPISFSA